MENGGCTCGNDNGENIEKAGNKIKTKKTQTPYKIVLSYEKEFKEDFGKVIGDMGLMLVKKLDKISK